MKALITGVTGQDGSYLVENLLSKGYEIHAFARRFETHENIHEIEKEINIYDVDISDLGSIVEVIRKTKPDEIYHLASQSFVEVSFTSPIFTAEVTGLGTLRILEACRLLNHNCRIYNAASSEMFGGGENLTETSPFMPRSPYGASKLFSYWMCRNYREAYGMYVSNGILFNHESPRRGIEFVTRRISNAVARIKLGKQKSIVLGNLKSIRDWGYAPDYVIGMNALLKQDYPMDIVMSTGVPHSVVDFAAEACKVGGLGDCVDHLQTDPSQVRPLDIDVLTGNPARAKKLLNWEAKTTFKELVRIMVEADIEREKSTDL